MLRKYQKIKRRFYFFITNISSKIAYRYLELDAGSKVSIFGLGICITSLFLPWVQSLDNVTLLPSGNLSENAFSIFTGYIGYAIILLLLFVLFTLLSEKRKERLKYFSLLDIPESILVLYTSSILGIICLQYFFIVGGFQIISQNIIYGTGLILCTTGSFLLLFGYILLKKSRKKQNTASYGYEGSDSAFEKRPNDSKNMKLPF
ncbi:hypothetical protein LAT59_02680 [Candidatus Gracilibacteria bacterium]|nr:hypothetical protein [Candidatus Gracilibacteria bacterium]